MGARIVSSFFSIALLKNPKTDFEKIYLPRFPSFSLPHFRMKQRRAASEARGWDDYVHVDITGSIEADKLVEEVSINGSGSSKRIPERIYGEHSKDEES